MLSACSTTEQKYNPRVNDDSAEVQPLTIGPMIGNVTDSSFRLWGRGTESAIGVVRIRNSETGDWSDTRSFELKEVADYTGTIDFSQYGNQKLSSQTKYEYQMGYVHKKYDDDLSKVSWGSQIPTGSVRTFPKLGSAEPTRFILGSCRDQTIWSEKGEDTFNSIAKLLELEKSNKYVPDTNFIIQSGDQIYVDLKSAIPFFSVGHLDIDEFWHTYRKAFDRPNYSKVLKNLPTYMILDDHEIQNDWTKGRFKEDKNYKEETHDNGLLAYKAYQASLNLDNKVASSSDSVINNYGYNFSHAQSDFFVLDTRSENEVSKKLINKCKDGATIQEPKIISDNQMDSLKVWLKNTPKEHIKFIVSPIPPFPDTKGSLGAPLDKWGGGVWQRHNLFEFIRIEKIQRVVFLSGDVHVSYVSELTYCPTKEACDPSFRIYNITSSPFNWSTSIGIGLQESNLDLEFDYKPMQRPALSDGGCTDTDVVSPSSNYYVRRYRSSPATPLIHKKNNFSRITAERNDINVEFFSGHTGKLLESTNIRFQVSPQDN